jgi:hypothetical protein
MQRFLINALLHAEMTLSTDIPPAGVCEALGPTATSTWLQLYWRHGDEDKANRRLNRGNRLRPLSGAHTKLRAFSGTRYSVTLAPGQPGALSQTRTTPLIQRLYRVEIDVVSLLNA